MQLGETANVVDIKQIFANSLFAKVLRNLKITLIVHQILATLSSNTPLETGNNRRTTLTNVSQLLIKGNHIIKNVESTVIDIQKSITKLNNQNRSFIGEYFPSM